MPYCVRCGVELDPEVRKCPLCASPVSLPDAARADESAPPRDAGPEHETFPGSPDHTHFTLGEQKKIAWEVISVAGIITALTLAAINLVLSRRLSWSLYPLSSLGFIWMAATGFLVLESKKAPRIILLVLALPLFLLALDSIEGGLGWSLSFGMPLALWIEAVIAAVALAIARMRRKGLTVIAAVLLGAAALCVGVEFFIDLLLRLPVGLTWSLICLLSMVPIALFLIYLDRRITHTTNLRRMFRL